MSEPFLAEIRIVGFNFAPRGWAFCDGQLLPINQNQSLYSLLGTMYGGDGRTSFALPDMRSRVPIHVGNGHTEGQKGGAETTPLSTNQLPGHTHSVMGSTSDADSPLAAGQVLANSPAADIYVDNASSPANMSTAAITNNGGGQSHNNMQPYLALNFCIALRGLFPSRN